MGQVAREKTPLTITQMAAILAEVHGTSKGAAYLENVLAIAALENGGGDAIIQHNWGNVMATDSWRKDGDFWERKDPSLKPRFFRAYPSHEDGARAFVKLLGGSRHIGALNAAEIDDTSGMVDSLFASHYVVPSPADKHPRGLSPQQQKAEYSNAVQSIREGFRTSKPFSGGEAPPSSTAPKSAILTLALPMLGLAFAAMVVTGRK